MVDPSTLSDYLLVIRDAGTPHRVRIGEDFIEVEFVAEQPEAPFTAVAPVEEDPPRVPAADQKPDTRTAYQRLFGSEVPGFQPATEPSSR